MGIDQSTLFAAIFALLVNSIALYKGFYTLPYKNRSFIPVSLKILLSSFGIYLFFTLVLAPIASKLLLQFLKIHDPSLTQLPITYISILQIAIMLVIFLVLMIVIAMQNAPLLVRIWKDVSIPSPRSIGYDFAVGILSWFLAFPIVVAISQLFDRVITHFFGPQLYEQSAVKFVKTTMESSFAASLTVFSVLILSPFVEEFLFRGCLQNYFKQHVGHRIAIFLSALAFSLFHYSTSQGIGNLSFTLSLLILGSFLGFLYERQASLFAPIGLHMVFNGISAVRILFFSEGAT